MEFTMTNLNITVTFNCTTSNTLFDALSAVAKDGHFDVEDLTFGLLGASDSMGAWGLSASPPLLLPVWFGKMVPKSPDAFDNKGEAFDHQSSTEVQVEVPSETLLDSGVTKLLECRLCVWHTQFHCIVGIDNAKTEPTKVYVDSSSASVEFYFGHHSAGAAGKVGWQSDVLLHRDRSLPECHITSTAAFRSIGSSTNGPYLHLVFYPHRNDLPFDADQWLLSLPADRREAFKEKKHTCRLRLTSATLVESNFTNWAAFDGSAARARAGLATCAVPANASAAARAEFRVGCPVPEPLRVVEPVRDPSAKGIRDNATMVSWTVTYDLSKLTHHIPVIEFEGYNLDASEPHKGSFCLLPDMFMLRDQTNGASGVAAISDDKKFVGPVYMNYSLVRPFKHEVNNFRSVRSIESFQKLHYKTLMGHRGLGKTYTDAVVDQKLRVQKLSENSIPSFVAAHLRGAGAVEFDVMLTSDQVPIVCHEPVFTVESITAGGHHMEQTEVFVHQVTKRRLDNLVKEALPAREDAQYKLKTLFEYHWRSILEIARGVRGNRPFYDPAEFVLGSSVPRDGSATRSQLKFGVTPVTANRERRRINLIDQSPFISRTPSHRDKGIQLLIPTLAEVMENTPPELGYNMEIKFPFQPKADRNLHLQSDNFEINRYCDLILDVVFRFIGQNREIGFSSFDPDICTAMMLKQTRYHVLFLADCAERVDQKDYRSWGLEPPIQFAVGERLAGVSIPSRSLLRPSDTETIIRNKVVSPRYISESRDKQRGKQDDPNLDTIDRDFSKGIVHVCNTRGLHVWTWGGANENSEWCDFQKSVAGVTGVITDNIPARSTEMEM